MLVRFVQAKLPKLNNIEHVKRIKRVQNEQGATELHVILCQSSSIGRQELVDRLAEFDPEWKSGEMILGEAAVPKHAPCTNEQYEEWKKIWPITFKNPTYKRADVSDAGEREYINRYMQLAFEQARQASES
ncbi:tRNA-specific adenosine deaminase subunit tad3, partial [Spiromyces aspiralis]